MSDELWIIRGDQPVLWTCPMRVTWPEKGEAQLFYAIPLTKYHEEFIRRKLAQHGRPYNGMWRLSWWQMKQIGEVAPEGIEPEACFSWERPARIPRTKIGIEPSQDVREFVDAIYQQGVGTSRTEVEYWWAIFCNAAFDWLVNKEKPVDMHFLLLHPSPLRVGWMRAAATYRPGRRKGKRVTTLDGYLRVVMMHEGTLAGRSAAIAADTLARGFMTNPARIALCRNGTIQRRVEVELKKSWWYTTKKIEKERLRVLGDCEYAATSLASLVRRFEASTRILADWICNFGHPFPRIAKGRAAGSFRFKKYKPAPNRTNPRIAGIFIGRRNASFIASPNKTNGQSLSPADVLVSALSLVQPQNKDLRNGGRQLLELPEKPVGAAGLPLPHAGESGNTNG